MQESAKYLIHAAFRATGVVERSDVVGAIFGQTEGLLGEELDLRTLQDSSKVGRIDVDLESAEGAVSGTVTIASGLDRVETAVLAAGLETIERIGPCHAEFTVTEIEDVRSAKRRAIVDRAEELLAEFDSAALRSHELVEEVRQRVRVADITEYEGLPAGPRVADSDAIVIVEGRADVRTLLQYGVKNAIAVEGTDIPDAVAALTENRTVTAFFDGDRGGELILRELAAVGEVDYVAMAPPDRAVEDLDRGEVLAALREKVPFDDAVGVPRPHDADADGPDAERPAGGPNDAGAVDTAPVEDATVEDAAVEAGAMEEQAMPDGAVEADTEPAGESAAERTDPDPVAEEAVGGAAPAGDGGGAELAAAEPETLGDHVAAVVGESKGTVRLLDAEMGTIDERPTADAIEAIEEAPELPAAVILDGTLSQAILDVAAQRGVGQVVTRETGEFVKQPTSVRIRTADSF